MSSTEYALAIVKRGYTRAVSEGEATYICQLTNNNLGFSREKIEAIKKSVENLEFKIPTHVSILPAGKKPSTVKLFDGLQEIYCNSQELKQVVESF